MRRVLALGIAVCTVAASAYAAGVSNRFPHMRLGIGNEPTAGGGIVAGVPYRTRSAVVAWNRRERTLTLYLIRLSGVSCGTLKREITRPGHVVQALIRARPLSAVVARPVPDQTLQFVTYYRNPKKHPLNAAGLKQGVSLVMTRVDSYPGGVWRGTLYVPTKVYGNGKVYGYRGSFAARWCDLRR